MTVAQCLNLLYNIVDRIYIGRIPGSGSLALSGVGLCFPIITMITAFTYLFGNGGGPLCAIERGRGNEREAEAIMGNTFVLLLATGFVLMTAGLLFYEPVLYLFGASDETNPYAKATGGQGVAFLFKNDPMKLTLENPMPFYQYPLQVRNLETVIPCEARTAGVIVYYPLSALIAVGVS